MNFQEMSDEEILSIANPMMDNLMDASTNIDHPKHVRDFSDRLKAIVTKDNLEHMCNAYQSEKGFFKDRTFVSTFKRPDSVAIVDFPDFARDLIKLECNLNRGIYEQRQTIYRRVQA